MAVVIPDETLREAGMTERELRIELACRLFDIGRLSFPAAARLAGLDRPSMEGELRLRQIPIYRPTVEDLNQDLEALKRLGI